MRPYEIHYAQVNWKDCPDERPWIIIEQRGSHYACFPISGQCYHGEGFCLDKQHPDFAATGLTKSCYIHHLRLYELPLEAFRRQTGELRGELLQQFLKDAGF